MRNLGKGFLISLCLHLIALSAMAGIGRMLERSEAADAVDISLLVIGPGGRGGASAGGLGPHAPAEGTASAALPGGVFNRTGSPEIARLAQPLAAEPLKEQKTAPPPVEEPRPRIPQKKTPHQKSLDGDASVPVKPIPEKTAPPEKEYSAKPPQPSKKRAAKAQPLKTEAPAPKPQQVPATPAQEFSPIPSKKETGQSPADAGAGAGQRGEPASMPGAGQGGASGATGSGGGPTGGAYGGNTGGSRGSVRGGAYFDRIHGLVRRHLEYPRQARRMGMTGRSYYSFIIEKDGAVTNLAVEKSSGFGPLDEAGLKAIRSASPLPPPPDRSHMVMPIDFRLR